MNEQTPIISEGQTELGAMDIQKILASAPHRYPMLLVDRVVELDPGVSCVGIKNVSYNEPQFTGHFPNQPIFPGVLLIEAMAQTGGLLVVASDPSVIGRPVFFMSIDEARFRKPVVPGDQVRMHVRLAKRIKTMYRFEADCRVDDVVVCNAKFTAMCI